MTDFPERFKPGIRVYTGSPPQPTEIRSVHLEPRAVTLGLGSVTTREAAERLRGSWILVHESDAHPLPEGQYYWYQLIGLRVVSDEGELLGELADIIETGSNDVYVVRGESRERLLPAIPDVVLQVDLEQGMMTVHLIPGLDEL